MAELGAFTPSDIVPYLSADALKAIQSFIGGTLQNLSATLIEMSLLKNPTIVVHIEDASGHPSGGRFEICLQQLLQQLQDRILQCIITQQHAISLKN